MWRILIAVVAIAAVLPGSIAQADDDDETLSAHVDSTATIVTHVVTNTSTNFVFEVANCPEGQPITITWDAAQPDKGDTSQGEGFYFSGPHQTQQLVLTIIGASSPGYQWVGSGTVACGLTVIPVSGNGSTNIVS